MTPLEALRAKRRGNYHTPEGMDRLKAARRTYWAHRVYWGGFDWAGEAL